MSLIIPKSLAEKASQFPESSYGACLVTLILASGQEIDDVVLAWGSEIVKIGGVSVTDESDLCFSLFEIVDVLPST